MAIEIKIPERRFGIVSPLVKPTQPITAPKDDLPALKKLANIFLPEKFEFKKEPVLKFEVGDMPTEYFNRYYKNELNLDFTPFDPEMTEQEKRLTVLQPFIKQKIIPKAPKRTEIVGPQPGLLFLEGFKKELSFGYFPTQLEAETMSEKIAQTVGEFAGITIPFAVTAGAISAARVIPTVGKFALRYPRMANVLQAGATFAGLSLIEKKEAGEGRAEKAAISGVFGLGFGAFPFLAMSTFQKFAPKLPKLFKEKMIGWAMKGNVKKYGEMLDKEITKIPLPKMEDPLQALNWKPPTMGYQNPYTKLATKFWDDTIQKFNKSELVPNSVKLGQNREVLALNREKLRIIDGTRKKIEDEILKPVRALSSEQQLRLGEMVNKTMPVTQELAGLTYKIDLEIGRFGRAYVDQYKKWLADGLIKKEDVLLSEETFIENLGQYARTFYLRPSALGTKIKPPTLRAKGIIETGQFKQKLTNEEWGRRALQFDGFTEKQVNTKTTEELVEIGLKAKRQYGWVTEADAMLSKTFRDLTENYSTMQWLDTIAKDTTLFSKEAQEGFIRVSELLPRGVTRDIRLGPLNNGWIHPGLADEIKFFNTSGRSPGGEFGRQLLGTWKLSKVGINPPTIARNFMSGHFIQTDMAGYPLWKPSNFKQYAKSQIDYWRRGELYKKLRDGGMYGADYFSVEISPALEKQLLGANDYVEFWEKASKLLAETNKTAGQYYGMIDHAARTYLASSALRDGAKISQAVGFANKWELDYRLVPPLIDKARTGAGIFFPFISFYALMAPRIMETLITRPWVLLKYPAAVEGLKRYTSAKSGFSPEQLEAMKPQWMEKNDYTIPVGTDRNGQPEYLNLDYTFPFGSWKTAFIDTQGFGMMASNLGAFGSVRGIMKNEDPFTGKEIYSETDSTLTKFTKSLRWGALAISPSVVYHGLNLKSAIEGEVVGFPPNETKKDISQAFLRLAGVSVYSGGRWAYQQKVNDYQRLIRDLTSSIQRTQRDKNLDTEEKRKVIEDAKKSITKLRNQITQLTRMMNTFDKKDVEIKETPQSKGATIKPIIPSRY